MSEISSHKILIDEKWTLIDLYQFPHAYTHVYGFIFSLTQTSPARETSVANIYRRYPWRGGYSAVNFFGELYHVMGKEHQPTVKSIQYASPGFIEIAAVVVLVATQLETIVKALANSINYADATYHQIYGRIMKRKLLSLDVRRHEREFTKEEVKFMVDSSRELSRVLKFKDLEKLQSRTKDDLTTLKILLSFYRRARELTEFYRSGKIRFEGDGQIQVFGRQALSALTVGRVYSRKEISSLLGGSEINFLPIHNHCHPGVTC